MPKSRLTMYVPFLLVILVQALFVGLYPSTGEDRSVTAGGSGGFDTEFAPPAAGGGFDQAATPGAPSSDGGAGGFTATTLAGGAAAGGGSQSGNAQTPAGGGSAAGAGGGTATPAGGGQTPAAGGGGGGQTAAAEDTSHCVNGRQMDVFVIPVENPVCRPKWPAGADNGGATWNGVTADKIRVVIMEAASSEAVDAVLKSQGLASTPEDREAVNEVAMAFFNKYYESYGREFEFIRFPAQCPTSPFDVPACIADTRKVIEMQPFAVFFNQPTYPELFEELTRAGIISVGGWHFTGPLFNERRPYRWDVFVDGTQSADFMIEYYCKKLQGKNASHSGATIHPLIGTRDSVARKLGIVVPDSPANRPDANRVQVGVSECGATDSTVYAYTQNIDQAQNEANGLVQSLVNDGVTTVLCMCDPIFPAFLTSAASSNSYFPEHMLAGTGLLDADQVGRLYTREQWIHAFGPSHLADTRPFADEQVSRAFTDQNAGTPCSSCNLPWVYYSVLGSMVHNAGPNLNPGTVEAGLFAQSRTRGTGQVIGLGYGPNDYSAIDDIREAYWVPTARSDVDGGTGSYRSMNNGKRYARGEFTAEFNVPVEPTGQG